ncbi:MAG: hypothetical protein KF767_14325 [Bdellovibrionaceae bacterium]|nr:hypothetical protein [Pseudobdellovibrionaceae bacterium]
MTAFADTNSDRYFEISEVVTKEVPKNLLKDAGSLTVVPDGVALGSCQQNGYPLEAGMDFNPIAALDATDVIVDKVINIGKKIWEIVQAGKPVLNIKTDVATALPQGARCWLDLQTWQMPESKIYSVAFKNGFGMEVVKFNYRVLWLPGGSVDGVGKFIGYAAMIPNDVSVSWGFGLNAQASVPTVFNMGTRAEPIGGMQLSMIYRIETPIQTTEQSQAYFVSGNGEYKQLD